MKKLLFLFFILPFIAKSQDTTLIVKDTSIGKNAAIIFSNGKMITEGDDIKCGRGTLPNGDFKYIHTNPGSFINIMSVSNANPTGSAYVSIGRQYSGLLLHVKDVKKVGNKRRGYKYMLKVGGGNIVNYICEIQDAVAVGEIVLK